MSDTEQYKTNPQHLILTAVASIAGTVAALGYYGYLHFAKPQDALLLAEFTMLKSVPGEDYGINAAPADQIAQCFDGVLVLIDLKQKGLSGVLVDNKKRAVRCNDGSAPGVLGSDEEQDPAGEPVEQAAAPEDSEAAAGDAPATPASSEAQDAAAPAIR